MWSRQAEIAELAAAVGARVPVAAEELAVVERRHLVEAASALPLIATIECAVMLERSPVRGRCRRSR